MIPIFKFRKGLFQFLNRFWNIHAWRSNYDVWLRVQKITLTWGRVCFRYDYWRDDPLGYYDTKDMMGLFAGLISQSFDAIRQGVWVFFYEQKTWGLHIQSTALSSLVITSMVSYAVFRTRFLHRIWYCS